MATLDFLQHSRTYLEHTQPRTLHHRKIVLSFLGEDYRMSRGQSQKALESVQATGLNVGFHTIRLDAAIYRNAYRWLTSTDKAELETLERLARTTKRAEMAGVASLIKDGFNHWEQVRPAETPIAPPPQPSVPATTSPQNGERQLVEIINKAAGRMLRRLHELETESTRLKEKLQVLEERERARRSWKIEDLANEFPEVAALLQLFNNGQAMDIQSAPTILATAASTTAAPESLPTSCPIMGRPIVYTKTFSKRLRGITDSRLRAKIVKSLQLLAEHGPGHPSLNHKQLRHDALGVKAGEGFIIRAGDRRILYRLTNEAVEFVAIVSRANKQVYSKE